MKWLLAALMLLLAVGLAACAGEVGPAETIEKYLQARVESDVDQLRQLSCAAWESQIEVEANSFAAVEASLQDMACEQSGEDGDATLVTCTGAIIIDYGAEQSELPLGSYRVVREDDVWKMCGEADSQG